MKRIFIGLILSQFLFSCVSIPMPRTGASLVVSISSFPLVSLETGKLIHLIQHDLIWIATAPSGMYSVKNNGFLSPSFLIGQGQVVMPPWVPGESGEWVEPDTSTSLLVLQEILALQGFPEWLGSELVGFQPHEVPRLLLGPSSRVRITSTPTGAAIKMNGVFYGKTPLELTVPFQGAMVELDLEGFKPLRTYSRWTSESNLKWTLEPSPIGSEIKTDKLRIMVSPFPDGVGNGAYSQTIAEALALNLRLQPSFDVQSQSFKSSEEDQWKAAESAGSHLLVSGWYRPLSPGLRVQATISDVATRRVIHTEVFDVVEGLKLFDELDSRSAAFVKKAIEGIPEPGAYYLVKQPPLTGDFLLLEREAWLDLHRKNLSQMRPWAVLSSGFGVFFPSKDVAGFETAQISGLVRLKGGFRVNNLLTFTGAVSTGLGSRSAFWMVGEAEPLNSQWYLGSLGLELALINGPFIVYINPEFSIGLETTASNSQAGFPFLHYGTTLDLGIRGMFHSHTLKPGLFWEAGMWTDLGLWTLDGNYPTLAEMLGFLHAGLGYQW